MAGVSEKLRRLLAAHPREVAKELLGWDLVRTLPEGEVVVCRLVETEAYHESEPGCHAHRGLTARNKAMFMRAGHAYIYFIYGVHHCLNVVCGEEGEGAAVLVRAAEPVVPLDLRLTGPGVLCRTLGVDRKLYAVDLLDPASPLFLRKKRLRRGETIATSPRIGLSPHQSPDLPWRFFVQDNPHVSLRRVKPHSVTR
jgi:DNA-3-methyladenine glycosylase